jgi:hypothetical protein
MKLNATYTAGLGAAVMFLLDPDRGRRRRAWLRDKGIRACRKTERAYQTTRRDLRNRARGVWARAAAVFGRSNPSDAVLLERVRAGIGRVVSQSQNIEVRVNDQRAVLEGTVLAGEVERLLSAVERIPGIHGVENRLVIEERAGDEADLRIENKRGGQFELMQNHWSPTARLVVSAGGSALAIYALKYRGILGSTLGMAGTALLLRSVGNKPYRELFRGTA